MKTRTSRTLKGRRHGAGWMAVLAVGLLAVVWTPAGQGAVMTFTDDFNRVVPSAEPLGPGWTTDSPPGNNQWVLDGATAKVKVAGVADRAYVEYPPLGDFYTVGLDIRYQSFVSNPIYLFGNRPLSPTATSWLAAYFDAGTTTADESYCGRMRAISCTKRGRPGPPTRSPVLS